MDIAIIGAGITGLSVAYSLLPIQEISFDLLEKENRTGGIIASHKEAGFLSEKGPHTIRIPTKVLYTFITEELGLKEEILEASKASTKERYTVKEKKLTRVPVGMKSFLTTPLFSAKAKLGLLGEFFTPPSKKEDESVAAFVKRRFGSEFLDYGVDPFISGIYAGNPEKLSLKYIFPNLYREEKKHGSILKAKFFHTKKNKEKFDSKIISFKSGMQMLTDALTQRTKEHIYLNTHIHEITYTKNKKWKICWECENKRRVKEYEHLILTLPTYQLTALPWEEKLKQPMQVLNEVEYVPMAVISLGYKQSDLPKALSGMGFLTPKKENLHILGAQYDSSVFSHRAPKGYELISVYIGGSRNRDLAMLETSSLEKIASKDLNTLLGITSQPTWKHTVQWKKAIPQYNLEHEFIIKSIEAIEKSFNGLHLLGNYKEGIGLPQCIEKGLTLGTKIKKDF